jgi:hypothetical protein
MQVFIALKIGNDIRRFTTTTKQVIQAKVATVTVSTCHAWPHKRQAFLFHFIKEGVYLFDFTKQVFRVFCLFSDSGG